MRKIVELPPQLAEKIAAGEVVNRPLSVVKELMENSLDAGAASIVAEIRNGGKSLIRITDDGCGIPGDQAETAFLRHATSKIACLADLERVQSLGFRGEALTSIAAVSRLELFTKTREEKAGVLLRMEGGRILEKKPLGTADGTTVIVSDLFFNTPARLKFMKADRAESALIIDLASKLALAYPHVRIRMINNDNVLFSTPGRGDLMTNILTIYGKEIGEGLLPLECRADGFSIRGYVSPPAKSRSSRKNQVFFINGRSVGSKTLERALTEAYRETMFEGRYPVAFLFVDVPAERLDVNIHPAKSEVRFDDEAALEAFAAEAVRGVILAKEAIPSAAVKNPFAFVRPGAPGARDEADGAWAGQDAGAGQDGAWAGQDAGDGAAGGARAGQRAGAGQDGAGTAGYLSGGQVDIIKLLSSKRAEQGTQPPAQADRVMEDAAPVIASAVPVIASAVPIIASAAKQSSPI
ncbi:MAG: DNA mismatch repair endonuclease MutL [Clostridiales Family XIII bacterium]|jgi:DNA mismatch repair protein MutL|nr:DNA mismatch repair endonuclease MutL [Clostridiales Family XIII bacterium]